MPAWTLHPMLALGAGLYFLSVLGLVLHAVGYSYLYWLRRLRYTRSPRPASRYAADALPVQVVQLPVYNENPEMVKQLVTSACQLDYPRERLFVQLLDDSDDPDIASELGRWVARFKRDHPDLDLSYLRRPDRRNFKAGNLNAGLDRIRPLLAQRGFADPRQIIISIFDADFLIPADYLNQTVDHFSATEVGAVQAELDYANQDANPMTQAQALFLTNLHRIDFATRSRSGHLTTYRGSAGSWRLAAIEAAGGWQGDTQVEDVDLSFAAQLKGWRIVFLDHLRVDCQLPEHLAAFKLQQRSWMKGLMEVFRKWAGPIRRASGLTVWQKIMAFDFFLVLSCQPLFIILGHLMVIPAWFFLKGFGYTHWLGGLTLGLLLLFCFTHFPMLMGRSGPAGNPASGEKRDPWKSMRKQIMAFGLIPSLFPALAYGLLEGLSGARVHRDRTLRAADNRGNADKGVNPGQGNLLVRILMFETAMALYSMAFIVWAVFAGEWLAGSILSCFALFYTLSACMTARTLWPGRTG